MSRIRDVFGALPSLETPRLVLRRLRATDVADVYAYASDPAVARTVTWEAHRSMEDSRAFVAATLRRYERGEVANWGMELRETGKIIGTCGYILWNVTHDSAEIAYALGRPWWNRGLMTEALRAVIAFGWERMGLHRIEAHCRTDNPASERVMLKLGMQFEGINRGALKMKGIYVDLKHYAILRSDVVPPATEARGALDVTDDGFRRE